MPSLFVTGTDTGIGKTHVACALLRQLHAAGISACGFKPVSAGCIETPRGLRNDDALALQAAAQTQEPYASINPYAFEPAVAPHLAAQAAGAVIDTAHLDQAHDQLAVRYDWIVVEGAGGWLVPLNDELTFGDWAAQRRWPVLLVVGMRLGCLNHALLTAAAIARQGRLAGWVANVLAPEEMPLLQENIATLRSRIAAPLLGIAAYGDSVTLDLQALQQTH
jgi:dethiobiotin synthetase